MTAQVAADLRAAAEVLRRDGWTQGLFHEWVAGRICHCADGAIQVATGVHVDLMFDPTVAGGVDYQTHWGARPRRLAALDVLRATALAGTPVPIWNDEPGRTADEVIAALEAAADAAEASDE